MKEKNPRNVTGISFGADVKILELAKIRCAELGIKSFSEYVKQLIRLDLGLPNYIDAYMNKNRKERAEKLISQHSPNDKKSKGK